MSSSTPRISVLSHAILALVAIRPRSGYDLMRVFGDTPLGTFSESPGAIYPALRRLESAGLVAGDVENADSLRPRKIFMATASGREALDSWLRAPVDPVEVRRRPRALNLRFSFLDQFVEDWQITEFLEQYVAEHERHRAELLAHRDGAASRLSRTGALAVDMGIAEIDARIAWAHAARVV